MLCDIKELIDSLEDDDVKGATYDEMSLQHEMTLSTDYPALTEIEGDFSGRLFERLWSKLVDKGLIVAFGDGYFALRGNVPVQTAPGLLGLS